MFNGIAFNEDYYVKNIKNEFNKLSNNLVKAHTKDIRYMVDRINNGENLKEIPIKLEDIRDKFKSSYIDLKNEDCLLCYI